MAFSLQPFSDSYENIRKIMNTDDKFTIYIHSYSVEMPLLKAVSISKKITSLIFMDPSIREYRFETNFRSMCSIKMIVSILESTDIQIDASFNDENEIIDLANFGKDFGNAEFFKPFYCIKKKTLNEENIDFLNVMGRIENKCSLLEMGYKEMNINEEISFIINNFSPMCNNSIFIEWCKNIDNYNFVESIVSSDELCLDSEDDLANFLQKINDDNIYERLFSYLYFDLCTKDTQYKLLDYIQSHDLLQSKVFQINVLSYLKHYISGGSTLIPGRYSKVSVSRIKRRSAKLLIEELDNKDEEINHLKNELENFNTFPPIKDKPNKFYSNITEAAARGKLSSIQFHIEQIHTDIETVDAGGRTALHNSAEHGNLAVVKYLIEVGKANKEARTSKGNTPLHSAVYSNNFSVIEYLVEKAHVNIDAVNSLNETPLLHAVRKDYYRTVIYLLRKGAKRDDRGEVENYLLQHSTD